MELFCNTYMSSSGKIPSPPPPSKSSEVYVELGLCLFLSLNRLFFFIILYTMWIQQ